MKNAALRLLLLLGAGLWLGGCASFDADASHGTGLADVRHFFVVSNLNDNHALDQRIATALQARGVEAGSGPLTMMPDNTQAIVTYQDNWAWDFGERLAYLRLAMHKPESNEVLAAATFSARIPSKDAPAVVAQLVTRLFASPAGATRPADQLPVSTGAPAGERKRSR
ncbi:MAG: hypothetical protein PSU94_10950 [Lacunisphaera sp.]|nr:hypothetical protein [Lacunisphaera sp.]